MNLNKNNMTGYLRKKRCIGASEPILDMRQIGDGLKNLVFHVTTPEKRLIVKQAHSRVQIKERWWTDRKRIFAEKNCIEILANVLPPDIFPDAMNEDRTNFILVTTAPSKDAVLWESELAGGRIDLQIAAQAGELLASVHNLTAGVREVKTMFKDLRGFEQLRIEPLYDQVAKSFPEIQKQVDTRAKELMNSLAVGHI